MSQHEKVSKHVVGNLTPPHPDVRSYISGFLVCLVLTVISFCLASAKSLNMHLAVALIGVLALVQFSVQLLKFLHIGREFRPRWKLAVFIIMLCIVVILVAGSLWIMSNLNYRMMQSPTTTNRYLQSQDGL